MIIYMSRATSKDRIRITHEWKKGIIANVGSTTTYPVDIIFHYIKERNIFDIINLFFDNTTKQIGFLDQCVLEQFWWIDNEIHRARYSKITHPTFYSGEYIFDNNDGERTIIEIRQPDIDGKHWRAEHIHIKRGSIDPEDVHKIVKPTFNEHIELHKETISGLYIMKIS